MKKKDEVKKATALSYKKGYTAPRIIAHGKGETAENIIKTAKKNNVPVFKDDKLADDLLNFEIGSDIPPELYEIVAEILVFVTKIDKIKREMYEE